ncbi:(d)CMP kinase [Candidatus Marinimicrobia bacterium]|nr:(d)CMP kinase [Candidatus Neomarinimicrobiota bacterium]
MIIAIDGPSGSGKSTTARLLARHLNITHLDTGAMYRVVTWGIRKENIDINDISGIISFLKKANISYKNANEIFLDGKLVSTEIRKKDITSNVSAVSALHEVREYLVDIQRKLGKKIDCVIEGRDIGSVVFPKADFKFFLTADLDVRSMRRKNELKKMGEDLSIDEIKASIQKRDLIDSSREFSPLKRPEDSIEIDSTDLTIDEQIGQIIKIIKKNKEGTSKHV